MCIVGFDFISSEVSPLCLGLPSASAWRNLTEAIFKSVLVLQHLQEA